MVDAKKPLGPSLALASYKANPPPGAIHRASPILLGFVRRFYVPSDGSGSCFTTIGRLIFFRRDAANPHFDRKKCMHVKISKTLVKPLGPSLGPGPLIKRTRPPTRPPAEPSTERPRSLRFRHYSVTTPIFWHACACNTHTMHGTCHGTCHAMHATYIGLHACNIPCESEPRQLLCAR